MASYIENQPVFLGEADACSNNDFVYSQLVDITDTTQVQLKIEPCASAEQIIINSNFDCIGDSCDGWSFGTNVAITDCGLTWSGSTIANTSMAYTDDLFTVDNYYQVNITVTSISGGGLNIYLGGTYLGNISSVGTFTFYGFATSPVLATTHLSIQADTNGVEACISNVTSFEVLTNFMFVIFDSNGEALELVSYNNNPSYFTFAKDTVTISVDWSEFVSGYDLGSCYYFCVLDPCINTNGQNYPANILNGHFIGNADNWNLGLAWHWTADTLVGNAAMSNQISQINVFNNYTNTYCIDINIDDGENIQLQVYFGETLVGTITTIGLHTVCGIPYGNGSLTLNLVTGDKVVISYIEPTPIQEYTCNLTSNFFKVDDYSSSCTILVNACNNEDGMGFVFDGSGFSPQLRIDAILKEPKYKNDRSTYVDSKGKKSVYYFAGRKQKYFATDLQPEYILDYLWTLFGYDNVYFDGVQYVIEDDEFTPDYSFANVGKVKFLVSKKTQDVKNTNCTSNERNCIIGESYLLKADNTSEYVTLTDGSYIIIQ